MQSEPANIYEAKNAQFAQEAERLRSFALPNEVSTEVIKTIKPNATFLDIGAGPSPVLREYVHEHSGKYTALDKNPGFLDTQKQGGTDVVLGDVRNLPFADDSFDIVHARFVIAHLGKDKQKAIREAIRVIKPGGRAIFIDFDWTVAHGSKAFNEFQASITSGSTLFDAGFGSKLEETVRGAMSPDTNFVAVKRYTPKKMHDYSQVLRLREAGNADFRAQHKEDERERWNLLLDKLKAESESNNPPGFYFPDLVAVVVSKGR